MIVILKYGCKNRNLKRRNQTRRKKKKQEEEEEVLEMENRTPQLLCKRFFFFCQRFAVQAFKIFLL